MGAEFERTDSKLNGGLKNNPHPETGNPDRRTDPNSSTATPRTGNTDTRTDNGTGNTAGTGKAEEKKISGLATVNTDGLPLPETPKKKTRKKRTTKKKEVSTSFDSKQISALLVSITAVIATRPNMSMFALTEMEAEQIAVPLSNLIAKSEKLSAVSEHSDAIALVTACLIIMLPRVMMYFDTLKQNKLKSNGGVKLVDRTGEKQKAESAGDNRKVTGTSTAVKSTNVNGVLASIPSIV